MKEAICIFQLSSNGLVILDLGCSYIASQISDISDPFRSLNSENFSDKLLVCDIFSSLFNTQ